MCTVCVCVLGRAWVCVHPCQCVHLCSAYVNVRVCLYVCVCAHMCKYVPLNRGGVWRSSEEEEEEEEEEEWCETG